MTININLDPMPKLKMNSSVLPLHYNHILIYKSKTA
ncbi:MAG: hypothetical protein RI973_1353 [Bacteroidota bacterium]|jgi:hypothetical protein